MSLAIGYVRVSSEQQAGEFQTSLADQRAAIVALADRLRVTLGTVFEDAGLSGATVAKRPGFRALLDYCAQHPQRPDAPGHVLVLNDSRFGRFDDPDEAPSLRFHLKAHGWIVRFAEGDEIEDRSIRHIMRAVGGAEASKYRANLRANSTRGRIGTTRQGFWATRAPFAYRRAVVYPTAQARVLDHGVPKARGEKIKLVPGPEDEVAMVREVFARYASGAYSMRALCRWMNAQPAARQGRQPWHVATLRNLLENHAYIGAIPARRRTAVRMERGDYRRHTPEYVVWDAHAPLVDRDIFDQVQQQLRQTPVRGDVADYRVRGLVTCATCGSVLMGGGLGSRLAAGGRSRFYVCQLGRERACPPRAACVTTHLLESAVIRAVGAHVLAEVSPAAIQQAFAARVQARDVRPARDLRKVRTGAETRRQRLVGAIESGALSAAEAKPRLDAIRAELEALDAAPAAETSVASTRAQLDRLVALGRDLVARCAMATGPELRALLRPWVDHMVFDKAARTLTLRLRTMAGVLTVADERDIVSHQQTVLVCVKVGRAA
jgi:DNA invertase Pin-like site-specific DNA recombinase